MKTHLTAVGLQIQTVKSHDAMATAMKGVTKTLVVMNKQMNLPELQKIMQEFMRENEIAEIQQEIMGDTLDDAMATEDSEEEEALIVQQVLDELGITAAEGLSAAPTKAMPTSAAAETAEESVADKDPALAELESRLANLRK